MSFRVLSYYYYCFIFSLSVVKIPRAKNIKLKSKVGMASGPVLHRQNQSSRALRPNWDTVQWPRVFGIDMTSRASRRKYQSSVSTVVVRKDRELALNAPWDSTAIGWKIYVLVRLVYFASLRLAVRSAAAPADLHSIVCRPIIIIIIIRG